MNKISNWWNSGKFSMSINRLLLSTVFLFGVGISSHIIMQNGIIVASNAVCRIDTTKPQDDTIVLGIDCEVNGSHIKTGFAKPSVVLEVIKKNADTLLCDVNASGRVNECKLPE